MILLLASIALGYQAYCRNSLYNDELSLWEDTVRNRPENPFAHNNLGLRLAVEPGRQEEAIAELRKAAALKADYAEPYDNLGNLLARIPGRTGEARACYEKAIALDPRSGAPHSNLAVLLFTQLNEPEAAIRHLREAVRLDPRAESVYLNLGSFLAHDPEHLGEAIRCLKKAMSLNPEDPMAHVVLGRIYSTGLGDTRKAQEEYEAALAVDPFCEDARQALETLGAVTGSGLEASGHSPAPKGIEAGSSRP